METALKIVMPSLRAQDVGRLARTCKALAEAARLITERRVGDATQGWENIAVPIENHVDDCLYPNFQYTPYSRLCDPSGLPFGGLWGGGEEVADTRRRGMSESEFGGAMVTGSVLLGPGIGCRCPTDCSTAGHGLSDGWSPEIFTEEGGRSCGSPVMRQSQPDTFEPLEEGLKKKKDNNKRRLQEQTGDSADFRTEEQESTEEILDSSKTFSSQAPPCPCSPFMGRKLAYNANSRLRISDVNRRKRSSASRHGPESGRGNEILEEREYFKQDLHQGVDDSSAAPGGMNDPPLIMECGQVCSCSYLCKYRVSQNGLAVRSEVVRTRFKGWGLCAKQEIPLGSFVCEYAGELITTGKARERQKSYDLEEQGKHWQGSALLTLREHLPSGQASVRVNVDATRMGNVARFINHSCDGGNLMPCFIRTAGCVIPKLALFARRGISHGEEFSYSYGTADADAETWKPCFCGTSACFGRLPSECT